MMAERMIAPDIESGRFAGEDLFDLMAATTAADVRAFLEATCAAPANYMGRDWKISEVYATWLMYGSERAEAEEPSTPKVVSPAIRLTADPESGYPRVSAYAQAAYGSRDPELLGAQLLTVDGASLFRVGVAAASEALRAGENAAVPVTYLAANGEMDEDLLRLFPLPEDPGWTASRHKTAAPKLFAVHRGPKWGFIDSSGSECIPLEFEAVRDPVEPFANGIEAVRHNGKSGFINLEGEWVIPPRFAMVKNFQGEVAPVNDTGAILAFEWRFIDRQGEEAIPTRNVPFGAAFSDGLCPVQEDEKIGFMNTAGKLVVPYRYTSANEGFRNGLAAVQLEKGGKYGYIGPEGTTVIPFKYSSAYPFYSERAIVSLGTESLLINREGVPQVRFPVTPAPSMFAKARVTGGMVRAVKDGKYGFMDAEGKIVVPIEYADAMTIFGDGLVGVTLTGSKRKAFGKLSGGWFFIDKTGKTILDTDFEQVSRFSGGACWVMSEGRWGLIGLDGKWRMRPRLKLMPTLFRQGLSRVILEVDTGGVIPEQVYVCMSPRGEVIWKP